jgi:hypothetical protein
MNLVHRWLKLLAGAARCSPDHEEWLPHDPLLSERNELV